MKSVCCYSITLYLLFNLCCAQENSVSIIPVWKEGLILNYKAQKIAFDSTADSSSTNTTNYRITIKIVKKTEENYKFFWNTKSQFNLTPEMKVFSNLIAKYADIPIIYTASKLGNFKDLINIDKVKQCVNEINDIMSKNKKPEERELFSKIMKNIMTDEFIKQTFTKDIQIYHNLYGAYLTLNDTRRFESSINFPIGNITLPVSVEITLKEINKEKDFYIVEINQIADKSKFSKSIKATLNKILESLNKQVPDSVNISGIDMRDNAKYVISLRNNIIKFCSFERTAEFLAMKKREYFEMKLSE